MLTIDQDGIIRDARVKVRLVPQIAHGYFLGLINAIVVHQTDSTTAKGTIEGYRTGEKGTGAHFLIDKDGTVYQTVSVYQKCWHVGPILSKCYQEHSCVQKEEGYYDSLKGHQKVVLMNQRELAKKYPDRFPSNSDSVGIELVGLYLKAEDIFEMPTPQQQLSLRWLVQELLDTLHLTRTDVYRHPDVSRKKAGEACDAVW